VTCVVRTPDLLTLHVRTSRLQITRARPVALRLLTPKVTIVTMTLAELTSRTGLDVLDHLEQDVAVPVVDGLQAQGDLIVIPAWYLPRVTVSANARWQTVPPEGVELLRGSAGANPHTLVADPGGCRWTDQVIDPEGLALGVIDARAVSFLLHPEHGGSGVAPGRYVVRRQRERAADTRFGLLRSTSTGASQAMNLFIAD
jgi:hypothetical protein